MAVKPKNDTIRMHQDIKNDFDRWCAKKKYGVQVHTNEFIFRELGHKYYKSWKTIENIVFNRTSTAIHFTSAQGSLFME